MQKTNVSKRESLETILNSDMQDSGVLQSQKSKPYMKVLKKGV